MTFGQVIKLLGDLSLNVKSLSDSVTFLKWLIPIAFAVIAILIAVLR